MKTIFRALTLAILMTVFAAVTVTPAFAQGDEVEANIALYKKYTDNYAGTIPQLKVAIEAGKEYIQKYGSNADYAAQVEFLKKDLPRIEAIVANAKKNDDFQALVKRFDTSYPAGNYDETYASGRELLAQKPDLLDVMIVLGSIGYDESLKNPANTKYNADTINYAKQAIQKIESGQTSKNYGAFGIYTYGDYQRSETNKNDKFPAKDNALGNLNYKIGYLMYFNQNQKKEAIPYFYKATKYDSSVKNLPIIYQVIGASYFDEAKRLSQESEAKAKAAGDKDTDESKAAYALAKGYADRAIDAYARAYKIASTNTGTKPEYKASLYKVLQDLFKFRYDGKIDGLDAFIASVMNKPFVDPSVAVTPVVEVTPATTSNSSLSGTSNATVAATPVSSKSTSTKSTTTTTTTVKPATGTTTTTTVKTVTKTKVPVKKPATKKKGTH